MAEVLKTNAIIDFAYFLSLKGGGPDSNYDQDRIEHLINAETDRLEKMTDRVFCPVSEDTEMFNGRGKGTHIVRQLHIVTDPVLSYWNMSAWTLMSETDYPREYTEDGLLWLTDGGVFERGSRNYKVVYSYGYARDDVPQILKECLAEMVHRAIMKFDGKQGMSSESFSDHSVSFDLANIPKGIQAVYNKFKVNKFGL